MVEDSDTSDSEVTFPIFKEGMVFTGVQVEPPPNAQPSRKDVVSDDEEDAIGSEDEEPAKEKEAGSMNVSVNKEVRPLFLPIS